MIGLLDGRIKGVCAGDYMQHPAPAGNQIPALIDGSAGMQHLNAVNQTAYGDLFSRLIGERIPAACQGDAAGIAA